MIDRVSARLLEAMERFPGTSLVRVTVILKRDASRTAARRALDRIREIAGSDADVDSVPHIGMVLCTVPSRAICGLASFPGVEWLDLDAREGPPVSPPPPFPLPTGQGRRDVRSERGGRWSSARKS